MPTGALSSIHYGYEKYFDSDADTAVAWAGEYKTLSSTAIYTLGHGIKITSLERANNVENIWGLGSRSAMANLEKQFTGSISFDTILSNPAIFSFIMGAGLVVGTASGASTSIKAATSAYAGSYEFDVTDITSMAVGDTLRLKNNSSDEDIVQIKSISGDTITVFSPLVFDYVATNTVKEYNDTISDGLYIHVYKEMDDLPSIQIKNSIELGGTDVQWLLKGCINNSAVISTAVNEPVACKLTFDYMDEVKSTDTFTEQLKETYDVYSFAHGTLTFPRSTSLGNVQSVEVTITQNDEVINTVGSRVGQTGVGKNREYKIDASVYFENPAKLMTYFYEGDGSATGPGNMEDATLRLVFDNGQAGSSNKTILLDFGKVKIDTDSLNQSVDAAIIEEVSMKARSCQVTAISNSKIPYIWP